MPVAVDPVQILTELGVAPSDELINEAFAHAELIQNQPQEALKKQIRSRLELDSAKRSCRRAAEAAAKSEELIHEMRQGHSLLCRLETVRTDGPRPVAVCRIGGQLQNFGVHPDVDLSRLLETKSWEYVAVHEGVVVDLWCDDPYLFDSAQGELVDFKGFADEASKRVRIMRNGTEELASLADSLHSEELDVNTKLVLQRDNPRWAIGSLPAQRAQSKFEVPFDQINTRLQDLAGMEPLIELLVLDIMKRIIKPEYRDEYVLDPLRGMLLISEKPGMGKTAFVRGFSLWLHEEGERLGFDVVLYVVPPNATKSMWHGEDSRIVREEIFGALRARCDLPRERALLQILVLDEADSIGRRPESGERVASAAQSDAVQSFLAELDGMIQQPPGDPPAHMLVIGMSNRPDMIDMAIKRPGRMGDLIVEMSELTREAAENICAIYCRGDKIPFQLNGKASKGCSSEDVLAKLIRPALDKIFDLPVVRYATDTQKKFDVTAGELLVGTHYKAAMNTAKNRAADRKLLGTGSPAVTYDDVMEGLLSAAVSVAESMQADPAMLIRQLRIKVPVVRVDAVPRVELETHRVVRGGTT